MAPINAFSSSEKTSHNSHKFGFTLSPTNYGYWKTMLQPFLITNNLFGYIDGTILCPPATILVTTSSGKDLADASISSQTNPEHITWINNDAHVRMLILSTISEASFQHVQGTTSRDLWLSLERAYAPHTSSREYTLKTQLSNIAMKCDESSSAYLTRAQEYSSALANISEPVKEKDLVMLVIYGLRDEYNGLKSTLLARQSPTAFSELHGLLADHDFMIKKLPTEVSPAQAFIATAHSRIPIPPETTVPSETLHDVQQLAQQLGFQLQPLANQNTAPAQANYTQRSGNSRNFNNRSGRGRGGSNNRQQGGRGSSQFSWASNQNTVYGTCNCRFAKIVID
ncbi:hypothetical protein LXL04_029417 [Taraxacum kok-saghyz]